MLFGGREFAFPSWDGQNDVIVREFVAQLAQAPSYLMSSELAISDAVSLRYERASADTPRMQPGMLLSTCGQAMLSWTFMR